MRFWICETNWRKCREAVAHSLLFKLLRSSRSNFLLIKQNFIIFVPRYLSKIERFKLKVLVWRGLFFIWNKKSFFEIFERNITEKIIIVDLKFMKFNHSFIRFIACNHVVLLVFRFYSDYVMINLAICGPLVLLCIYCKKCFKCFFPAFI